ncbi:chain-length determining protein [Paraburkholderia susongensis]|uniref:Capsular polysaccharide transport system permease protein n=1 Tax=Paraburkholderia susongensis TaxID=1515439 RepID=A0A1X7LTR2_9BURK|nr:chain-length determining protein [Paraburkholderia susongensis]SMG56529.1 capsular polysaccharide transport system permease protein [Paraburkholderia susongensis]
MSETSISSADFANRVSGFYGVSKKWIFSVKVFRLIVRLIVVYAILSIPYWLFFSSNRYVSSATVVLQSTDQLGGSGGSSPIGIASIAGIGSQNSGDQLLLSSYLLSLDMLNKLDAAFDLRSHYSNWHKDPFSRMWFKDEPIEWFYKYWLSRVDVEYDDYNGVLDITVQAYDPETAQKIVQFMIREGQAHMNLIGHQIAQSQVDFLTKQVALTHDRLLESTRNLIDFQNRQGLVAPQATAENLNAIIANLETQKTAIQTQLASLPATLNPNQPTVVMLKKNLSAIEGQISQKRAELASPSRRTLNYTVEEFQRLQMQVSFTGDLYKTALSALEQGRMNAARTLKMVSILQAPTLPGYPMEPTRFYNAFVTLLVALATIGVVKLVESIVLDHVD